MENTNVTELLVTDKELSLVEANSLNASQLQHLLKRTPEKHIKARPAKGGGQWEYVTGGYVKKVLNLMFGWDWDFEIMDEKVLLEAKQVIVKGKLTCRSNGHTIVKMQYGRQDVKFRRDSQDPLDLGNDMKGAATDCLKKCASEIGIAADVYNKEEFREFSVTTSENLKERIQDLYMEVEHLLSEDDKVHVDRIIQNNEEASFNKVYRNLQKFKK